MSQHTWDIITKTTNAVWPLLTALVGIFIGATLTTRNQKRQWLADNKKQEYRELLTALTGACTAIIETKQDPTNTTAERGAAYNEYIKSLGICQDRIFIAQDIEKMSLFDRWGDAVEHLHKTKDLVKFNDTFEVLRKEIVQAAVKV